MNIVELHEKVRFWTDRVGSARIGTESMDMAINTAMNEIVKQKYYAGQLSEKGDSFQRTQKVRDELSKIVRAKEFTVESGDVQIPAPGTLLVKASAFPSDYRYLLCIQVSNASGGFNCWPITYDEKNIFPSNPYRRVSAHPLSRRYYIESEDGITITHQLSSPTKVSIYYLSSPVQWKYGSEKTSSHNFIAGQKFIVTSLTAVYATNLYDRGTEVTVAAPTLSITSGSVLSGYINSNLNPSVHELIAREAAVNVLLSIKEFDKAKSLREYFM